MLLLGDCNCDIPFSSGGTLSKGGKPTEMCSEESSQDGEGSELLGDMRCPEKPGISSDLSPGSGSVAFSGRVAPRHRTRIRAGTQGVELTEIQASAQGPGYRGWAASPAVWP